MTIDDIKEYVEHELDMNSKYGHPTVDEIRTEAVDLMKAGGMSIKKAEKVFESIVKE